MPKLDYRNIEQDPARCGGQPVVGGTRVRVAIIVMSALDKRQSAVQGLGDWSGRYVSPVELGCFVADD